MEKKPESKPRCKTRRAAPALVAAALASLSPAQAANHVNSSPHNNRTVESHGPKTSKPPVPFRVAGESHESAVVKQVMSLFVGVDGMCV